MATHWEHQTNIMLSYSGKDIYCDLIIPKKLDVELIKETDTVLAFFHTKPYWQVHAIVTPKIHIASLLELSDTLTLEMLAVIKEASGSIKEKYGACRVVTNLGDF